MTNRLEAVGRWLDDLRQFWNLCPDLAQVIVGYPGLHWVNVWDTMGKLTMVNVGNLEAAAEKMANTIIAGDKQIAYVEYCLANGQVPMIRGKLYPVDRLEADRQKLEGWRGELEQIETQIVSVIRDWLEAEKDHRFCWIRRRAGVETACIMSSRYIYGLPEGTELWLPGDIAVLRRVSVLMADNSFEKARLSALPIDELIDECGQLDPIQQLKSADKKRAVARIEEIRQQEADGLAVPYSAKEKGNDRTKKNPTGMTGGDGSDFGKL